MQTDRELDIETQTENQLDLNQETESLVKPVEKPSSAQTEAKWKLLAITGWLLLFILLIFNNTLGSFIPYSSYIYNQNNVAAYSSDLDAKQKILNILNDKYIGDFPTAEKIKQGELEGIVNSFKDQYTSYYTCEEFKAFQDDLNQNFEGIGVKFKQADEEMVIDDVLDNFPAQKAGLKINDILLKVNDVDVQDLGFSETIKNIRGKAGTSVKLLIDRPSSMDPDNKTYQNLEFLISREKIHQDAVVLEVKEDVAWIKVSTFSSELDAQMRNIVQKIKQNSSIKKVVLDLRDNGGGLLDQSIQLSSYFLPAGKVVVQEKTKSQSSNQKTVDKSQNLLNYPLAVLVNGETASASEIVSGALQDYGRAKIVGKKTFGKGVVQSIEDLDGCNKLKVTIAEWLTPNGRTINKTGIIPDIKIGRGEDYFQKAVEAI